MKTTHTKQNKFSLGGWKGIALLLCMALFSIVAVFLLYQPWVGDYWEHRAVILELLQRPFDPQHPIVRSTQPHPFYSPYLVGWALAGRALGATGGQVLNCMAGVNLLLWLGAVCLLSRMFLPQRNTAQSFTILLLTLLFCWGFDPPNFSSFFHFSTLLYVLPYPSTFSFVAAVAGAWLALQLMSSNKNCMYQVLQLMILILLTAVVLLTHPLTFFLQLMLMLMGYVQVAQMHQKWVLKKPVILLSIAIAAAFLLAFFWPWYPFGQLLQYAEDAHRFHTDSRELYSNIYLELYPLLLPGLLMALQPRSFWKQQLPFWVALIIAGILFFYGWFSQHYGWGRMLAFGTLIAQLLVVRFVLCTPSRVKGTLMFTLMLVLALPYFIRAISNQVGLLKKTPSVLLSEKASTTAQLSPAALAHQLQFVQQQVPPGSLVLANRYCNRYLPGYSIRVVASSFPSYFITDVSPQQLNWERFFQSSATAAERQLLLQQLHPDAILLAPEEHWLLAELQTQYGWQPVKEANGFVLLLFTP